MVGSRPGTAAPKKSTTLGGAAQGHSPRELLQSVFPRPWQEIETTLRGHGRWEGEVQQRAKDGRAVTVSAKLQVLQSPDGVVRVLQSDHDVTGYKRTEEALLKAIGDLREDDRNKNHFLAMLSHELRNPLAPIRNSLYLLDRVPPGGEQAKSARAVIDRQIGHMTRLIEDLLDVTRIARGKIRIQREPVDLRELVPRTVEDHRSLFTDRLELEVAVGDEAVQVHGDRIRLSQAIGNLLSNSAKFTAPGGRVRLILELDAQAGQAIVRIRDTGVGIDPSMLSRVFEPFAQAEEDNLARTHGGLGLGLALVRGIVEMHGGTVAAHSEGLGAGAEFTIRLPLGESAPAALVTATTSPNRARRRVLVIEDNVDAADSLRALLELGEHEVEIAHDGPEGLMKAREFKPEVVICDVGLPQMNGYEVARAFRADEALRSAYLVALTGYALSSDIDRANEAGFDRHLAKPPNVEDLEQVLANGPAASDAR